MGQIQQHEWENLERGSKEARRQCLHCGVIEITMWDAYVYYFDGVLYAAIEPACITRTNGKEAEQNGTTN